VKKTLAPAPTPASASVAGPALPGGLRRFLYFTASVTGGVIMIVEILGAKMLSPYVGLSHFVWTAQIAVTLVALACGYYAGGKLADRSQRLNLLYWAILIAAGYLAGTVLVCEPVAYWCLDFNLAVGSLLASAILFFVPLALLAMTGPFLVRVITSSVAGVGGNVGRLTAISTLGSFAGTMLIGYLMIPLLPNSWTMYVTAMALALVALAYFGVWRRSGLAGALAVFALAALSAVGVQRTLHPEYTAVVEEFRGNSHFGRLQVVSHRLTSIRYYLNDNLVQNTYDPERKQSASTFTYMLHCLARAYTTNISDVLCIGLGVGIVPMEFAHDGAHVDVVEINPAVVPVAERFFNLDRKRINLTFDDGRHFLNRCRKQYDVVVLDAFLGDSSPSHLMTREAFQSIHRVLRPGGTLVINMFGHLEPDQDFFTASLDKTLKSVFAGVRIHTPGQGGFFFAAMNRPSPTFVHPPELADVHPKAKEETEAAFVNVVETQPDHGRILTDDYNPVEYYDAKNREEVRRRLAMMAKEM
jgi:spermidine synthase